MKKLVVAFLSMMLAVCLSVSAVTLFASAASGTDLAVADDPTYTTTVDLKGENVADDFVAVFAASGGAVTAGKATDIWDYDAEKGTFTSKEALSTVDEVWSNFYYLYYTGANYRNFYMEVTLTHQTLRGGWSGLAYGVQDVTKPAKGATENPFGGLSFVQGDGKYTWHNPKVNATEWNDTGIVATGFNGLTDTVHKLKVYDGHMQYWLNDEANVVVDVAVPEGGLTAGKVGIAVTNKAVAVKSIKITRLNGEGVPGSDGAEDIVIPESLQVTGITDGQNAVVGTPIAVSTAISPAGASQAVSFSSDPAGASYADGKLLFKNAGTYKLTFAAVENPAIKQEFTVNVSAMSAPEGYIHYELTEAGMARFETVFIAGGSGNGGVAANWSDYFTLENGELTRSGDSTGNVGNNYAVLYFRNRTLKNFELIYTAKGNSSNGWFGAFFAMTDTTQVGNQNGVMAFMQNASAAKNATLWGGTVSGIGGPYEHGTNYVQNEWSTFKIRVVNGTIEFYVNDMSTPAVTQNSANDLTGRIALFADDGCAGAFKDVYLGILDDNGDVVPYTAVESVSIGNKAETAYAGDTFTVQATVSPADAADTSLAYSTSDAAVATVSENGVVNFLKGGSVTIAVYSVDNPAIYDSFTVNVLVHVSSVEITNAPVTALEGTQLTLAVTVLPEDATNKSLSFSSSDDEVAFVSEDGVVSFLKPGKATITVTSADGSKTDAFEVEVTAKPVPVESLIIENKPESARVGDEFTLKVTILPAEATDKSVTYTSSNNEVATVSPGGKVTFLKEGEVTITVTSVSDPDIKDSFTIQVGAAPVLVSSVAISNKPTSVREGDTLALQVTVSPENAENKALTYQSSDESIALVDTNGNISFLRPGNVTITVMSESNPDATDSFTVSVAMNLDGYIHYELTEAGMANFETVFIAGGSGNSGTSANWSDYFTLENGELTRSGDSTGKVGENYAVLYFRNRTLKNFELIYTAKGNSSNGWFGAFFAMTDTTQAGNQNGAMAFMQNASANKAATLWGGPISGIGGPGGMEVGSTYVQNEWSTFKLRVVNGLIQFYVNDMSTPLVTKQATNDLTGRIALFADDGCAGAFKDVYLGILNDNGDVVPYKAVESVSIGNKQATAEVGDKIDLNVSVLPADATDASVEYDSSNPVVASIDKTDGTVTCITAGETTITVTSKEDPSKSDSFTLTVSTPSVPVSSVSITNKTDSAKVGDSLTLKVSVSPSNASDKSVTYASSDTSVATVEDGVVSFLKAGTVTITVKSVADPSKSDSFTVTVTEKDEDPGENPGGDPGENPGGDPGEDPTDPEPSGGCSSAVFGGSMALALVLAGGAAAVLRKKKH